MKLVEFSYDDGSWRLENLRLKDVNLLVGRSTTGKSRTLSTIYRLCKFIEQKIELKQGLFWYMKFINKKQQKIEYNFTLELSTLRKVLEEKIFVDGEQVLDREYDLTGDSGKAKLKSKITGEFDEIYPPKNKLVLHVRRDAKHYPYLEDIAIWAENSYGFRFGNSHVYNRDYQHNLLVTIEFAPHYLQDLDEERKDNIITNLKKVGYNVERIDVEKDNSKTLPTIYIWEQGVGKLTHYELSQGLLRTLSILIYLEYLLYKEKPTTILIDDLCEGLDYKRAIRLGKLIFEKCNDSNIQLIATSNDNFLMDAVDIKHWNLLTRDGSIVHAINYETSPELFDKFRLTGLSNFDFFASDYLKQQV